MGNRNLRRVELAWGASIAAEWAHFVALGVFAYTEGGATGGTGHQDKHHKHGKRSHRH